MRRPQAARGKFARSAPPSKTRPPRPKTGSGARAPRRRRVPAVGGRASASAERSAGRCLWRERGGGTPPRVKTGREYSPPQELLPHKEGTGPLARTGPPVPSTSAPGLRPGLSSPPQGQRRVRSPSRRRAMLRRRSPHGACRSVIGTGGRPPAAQRRKPGPSTGALALRPSAPQALPDGTHHRVRQPPSAKPMRSGSTIPGPPRLSRPLDRRTPPSAVPSRRSARSGPTPVIDLQGGVPIL